MGSPLLLYKQMLCSGVRPSGHTFMNLIRNSKNRIGFREGEEIHASLVKFGYGCSQFVASALIGHYNGFGCVEIGRKVFDEMPQRGLVLWTALIRGYVSARCAEEGLRLFVKMREVGVMPDNVALAIVVSGCSQLGGFDTGRLVHGFICKSGVQIDDFVSNELIGMYGECGSLDDVYRLFHETSSRNVVVWNNMIHQCTNHEELDLASELFKKVEFRDVVTWNTMIGGLVRVGRCKEALELFHEMEGYSGEEPNRLTMLSTLSACASLGALDVGTWLHAYIEKKSLNSDGSLDSSLIDMYSKCGCIGKAIQVFDKVPVRDVIAWTSLICGLAMHGHGKECITQFCRMQEAGAKPDDVTMVGVLNACAHAGLLEQGLQYFYSIETAYNLTPKIEHYGCIIDLLGRMGRLREAYNLINEMPLAPNEVIWGTLLSACRVHKNVELGELVAKRMLELNPSDPWIRVVMSNMNAEAMNWDVVMKLRKELKEEGVKKVPGCSSIEVNGMVHEFVIGDSSHPQHSEIHLLLEKFEATLNL
ncbi:hypothetical protein Scep_030050 [Stephania cephalantha]|uniref:Chlororespiratory reduction 4 n=1 Tax=Stephania cephalantha TaxID=152367 RepID=A0AAP0HE04_9MAGN